MTPFESLGHTSLDLEGCTLVNGLGQGRFSSVFLGSKDAEQVVVKIFPSTLESAHDMVEMEATMLNALKRVGVANVPTFKWTLHKAGFSALAVLPVGLPVLPCPTNARLTPSMMVALVDVVKAAHVLGWVHRDIKPDNIFLDQNDLTKIVLNDWSSAVQAAHSWGHCSSAMDPMQTRGMCLMQG
jgi:serine/threonine protein kinase